MFDADQIFRLAVADSMQKRENKCILIQKKIRLFSRKDWKIIFFHELSTYSRAND